MMKTNFLVVDTGLFSPTYHKKVIVTLAGDKELVDDLRQRIEKWASDKNLEVS